MQTVGWVSVRDVLVGLGNPLLGSTDTASLVTTVEAANAFIADARPDLAYPWVPTAFDTLTQSASIAVDYLPRIGLGAVMLATRWWQRRGTGDNSLVGEFGLIPTIDRDLESILGVNRAAGPVVS